MREPYPFINKEYMTGETNRYSPDPLYGMRWPFPTAESGLEVMVRRPVRAWTDTPEVFEGYQRLSQNRLENDEAPCCMRVQGEGMLCLDFGTECAGWLEADSPSSEGGFLLGISEYNQPAFVNSGPKSPAKTAKPVRYPQPDGSCTYRLELNEELYEGVRFGFLFAEKTKEPFQITDIRLICQVKPVNYEGAFSCDSEVMNRIWYTAAYSVRVNLRQDYFSALLMDRGDRFSWTGDAYPAQAAALAAFANDDFILKNLYYTSEHSNGIEGYEMYWLFSLKDYYRYSGDLEGIRGLKERAWSRFTHALEIFDTDFPITFAGWDERLGAGFENPDMEINRFAYRCMALRAMESLAPVFAELGEEQRKKQLLEWAEGKRPELTAEFAEICRSEGGPGIHAAAEAVLAGICSEGERKQLGERYFTDPVNRLSLSPFNQYFLLQAMALMGRYEEALDTVEDLWGGQLEHGATTFYETFRPRWNRFLGRNDPVPNHQAGYTSLAHSWSAGVLPWMQEELLGIRPVLAGFRSFAVLPHPGSRIRSLSGKTPTPYGKIEFCWDRGSGLCSLLVPGGTRGLLGLPKAGGGLTLLSVDGGLPDSLEEDAEFIYVECAEGFHEVRFRTEGKSKSHRPEAYPDQMEAPKEDAFTCGNWKTVYGTLGHVFFNGTEGGVGTEVLPEFVDQVVCKKAKQIRWEHVVSGCCVLEDFYGEKSGQGFGGLCTNDPVACDQTFTVDIRFRRPAECRLTLYFADGDGKGRVSEAELYHLGSLELAALPVLVKEYEKGKYVSFSCRDSVRVRVNQVRGENAVLCGLFFDG